MAKILSVKELNVYIKGVFLDEILLHGIQVYGEITEFNVSGGNTYITLREDDYNLSCVKFGASEPMTVGSRVLAFGSVAFYEKGGRVSFVAKSIAPYGAGEAAAALAKIKDAMRKEGLFENRKRLPGFIRRVAFISSVSGAVVHDFLSVLSGRRKIDVRVYDTRVQGEGADADIIAALTSAVADKSNDCVVIARGGGSAADLSVFNSERLARAVAASPLPVVSAVGHETDYTLCDLCAGHRAGTPSIAAELIASVLDAAFDRVGKAAVALSGGADALYGRKIAGLLAAGEKLSALTRLKTAVCEGELKHGAARMNFAARALLTRFAASVGSLAGRANAGAEKLIRDKESRFIRCDALLSKSGPLQILSLGYARISKDGKPVDGADGVNAGDNINITMRDGVICAVVTEKRKAVLR
ncbi:MAG: exodeoxyribonuclease VII large subunit [Clostridiales bacterium]|jgi:exodeoxyribonuclease VII large subunit|nr:exodeoxyribonuclease VII large subunit [Clostridiales bacterium]